MRKNQKMTQSKSGSDRYYYWSGQIIGGPIRQFLVVTIFVGVVVSFVETHARLPDEDILAMEKVADPTPKGTVNPVVVIDPVDTNPGPVNNKPIELPMQPGDCPPAEKDVCEQNYAVCEKFHRQLQNARRDISNATMKRSPTATYETKAQSLAAECNKYCSEDKETECRTAVKDRPTVCREKNFDELISGLRNNCVATPLPIASEGAYKEYTQTEAIELQVTNDRHAYVYGNDYTAGADPKAADQHTSAVFPYRDSQYGDSFCYTVYSSGQVQCRAESGGQQYTVSPIDMGVASYYPEIANRPISSVPIPRDNPFRSPIAAPALVPVVEPPATAAVVRTPESAKLGATNGSPSPTTSGTSGTTSAGKNPYGYNNFLANNPVQNNGTMGALGGNSSGTASSAGTFTANYNSQMGNIMADTRGETSQNSGTATQISGSAADLVSGHNSLAGVNGGISKANYTGTTAAIQNTDDAGAITPVAVGPDGRARGGIPGSSLAAAKASVGANKGDPDKFKTFGFGSWFAKGGKWMPGANKMADKGKKVRRRSRLASASSGECKTGKETACLMSALQGRQLRFMASKNGRLPKEIGTGYEDILTRASIRFPPLLPTDHEGMLDPHASPIK